MGEGEEDAEKDASLVNVVGVREEVGLREARPEATVLWATFLTIMAVEVGGVEQWEFGASLSAAPMRRARSVKRASFGLPRRRNKPAPTPHLCLRSTTISSKTAVPTL